MASVSIPIDIRGLDNGPPLLHFSLLKGSERVGRLLATRENLLSEVGEALTHDRVDQCIHDGGIESGNDLPWRALRHPESLPVGEVESRQASLIHRRDIWRGCHPVHCRGGVCFYCTGTHLRQAIGGVIDDHVNLASYKVLHVRAAAAIGYELDANPCEFLEQDAADVRRAAHARGPYCGVARVGLQPSD